MIYPWQIKQWQQLLLAREAKRLPHALLFSGLSGIGKVHFTRHFLHSLLCEQIDLSNININCACHPCRLIRQEAHPNILWITSEKRGQAIKIDQIREINNFAHQSAFEGEHYFIVIQPAEKMNHHSANAVLKILEEPPLGCIFILVSDQHTLLPLTILSRCQSIFFPIPSEEVALAWLEKEQAPSAKSLLTIANGAPLAALQLSTDFLTSRQILFEALLLLPKDPARILSTALSLQEIQITLLLDMIYSWSMDILRLQSNIIYIANQDYKKQLIDLSEAINNFTNIQFMLYLNVVRQDLSVDIHLNKQLLIENILIRYFNLNKGRVTK